jgi:hypothetical protein
MNKQENVTQKRQPRDEDTKKGSSAEKRQKDGKKQQGMTIKDYGFCQHVFVACPLFMLEIGITFKNEVFSK